MKETGMLFNGAMVRALLDGRKTQTRRQLSKKMLETFKIAALAGEVSNFIEEGKLGKNDLSYILAFSPFGKVGDRIWVRETWNWFDPENIPPRRRGSRAPFIGAEGSRKIEWVAAYAADGDLPYPGYGGDNHWKPSIHMPRWASRITLEITDVRIERLHDISEADAIAEGLAAVTKDGKLFKHGIPDLDGLPGRDNLGWPWHEWEVDPRKAFKKLWESTGGDWNANPWVWVIEFKTLETGAV